MAQQILNSNSVQPFGTLNMGSGTDEGDTWNTVAAKLNAMFNEMYTGTTLLAGTGGATFGSSGNIVKTAGPIQSSGTTSTQTLATYSMPANTLNGIGQALDITAWGAVAANAAPKSITLNVGGATYTTGTDTGSGFSWILEASTILTATGTAGTEDTIFTGQASGALLAPKNSTDTSAPTSAITINVQMADASAATGNVTLYGFTIEYFR